MLVLLTHPALRDAKLRVSWESVQGTKEAMSTISLAVHLETG